MFAPVSGSFSLVAECCPWDFEWWAKQHQAVVDCHACPVVFNRCGAKGQPNRKLARQMVRVALVGGNRPESDERTGAVKWQAVIAGPSDLDIEIKDTFEWEGQMYCVTGIRPHRHSGVQARAEMQD